MLVDLCILPGCIDSHMHLWETGFTARSDFRDATLASIAGGVTTIIDQPLTLPEVLNSEIINQKVSLGEKTSYTDFALHGGVGLENLEDLEGLWQAGCTAFKIFMYESGSAIAGLDDGRILAALQKIGSFGGNAIVHAENNDMLIHNRKILDEAGRVDPMAFVEWRPPEAEYEAINCIVHLAETTGTRLAVLHTTLPEGVDLINQARQRGVDVWVETCPHNLLLNP
ncbi:MAG: hypothetical protein SVP52_06470 [Chloroflexota bacterium]|nr:hypothetical protein [Chloroflexota bacterium]